MRAYVLNFFNDRLSAGPKSWTGSCLQPRPRWPQQDGGSPLLPFRFGCVVGPCQQEFPPGAQPRRGTHSGFSLRRVEDTGIACFLLTVWQVRLEDERASDDGSMDLKLTTTILALAKIVDVFGGDRFEDVIVFQEIDRGMAMVFECL